MRFRLLIECKFRENIVTNSAVTMCLFAIIGMVATGANYTPVGKCVLSFVSVIPGVSLWGFILFPPVFGFYTNRDGYAAKWKVFADDLPSARTSRREIGRGNERQIKADQVASY